jgi:hypothetical protein
VKLVLREGEASDEVKELTVGELPSSGMAAPLAVDVFVVAGVVLNVASTVNVYSVPLVSPEIVHEVVDVVHEKPPGFDVAV